MVSPYHIVACHKDALTGYSYKDTSKFRHYGKRLCGTFCLRTSHLDAILTVYITIDISLTAVKDVSKCHQFVTIVRSIHTQLASDIFERQMFSNASEHAVI